MGTGISLINLYIIVTMKASVPLFVALFLPCFLPIGSGLSAQDRQETAEPAVNQFFFFVSPGEFKPLERQTAGVPRSKSYSVIEGNRSTLRFVQGEPLVFVIRLASENVDPASAVKLLKLKPQGNHRLLERTTGSAPFEAEAYGESSFKIKPKGDLAAGDYALILVGEKDAYCFGVDAASKDLK